MAELEEDPVALRRLIDSADDIIAVMDADYRRTFISTAMKRVLGYDHVSEMFPAEAVHPDDRAKVRAAAEEVRQGEETWTLEFRVRHADGSWRWVESTFADRRDNPHIRGVVSVTRDITARKDAETEFRHLTTRDALTGLPNRGLMTERLDQRTAALQVGSHPVAVVMIDIDGFRVVNEELGRHVGDAALKAVAARLEQSACPECLVGRYGGDEFVVMHTPDAQVATEELVQRIEAALAVPVEAEGLPVPFQVTVGAYETTVPGRTAQQLIAFAVAATHNLKEMKRGR